MSKILTRGYPVILLIGAMLVLAMNPVGAANYTTTQISTQGGGFIGALSQNQRQRRGGLGRQLL